MPPYLPPAEHARQRLVEAIRDLDMVKRRSVRGGGRHLLLFAYALAMQVGRPLKVETFTTELICLVLVGGHRRARTSRWNASGCVRRHLAEHRDRFRGSLPEAPEPGSGRLRGYYHASFIIIIIIIVMKMYPYIGTASTLYNYIDSSS